MRISTRGPLHGHCNICGQLAKLTEDHIPPKGIIRPKQVELMTLTEMLSAERPRKSSRYFQSGVTYRTLCHACNTDLLGSKYDPSLVMLANEVRAYGLSTLTLPAVSAFTVRQNKVCRSVVGHLLAHGLESNRKGTALVQLTDYLLNPAATFPADIKLYYWLYPYDDQVVLKSFAFSAHYWNGLVVGMLMKFFPLSFLFTIDQPPEVNLSLDRLDDQLTQDIQDERRLLVRFSGLPLRRWPECPSDETMVLHAPNAVAAVPRAA